MAYRTEIQYSLSFVYNHTSSRKVLTNTGTQFHLPLFLCVCVCVCVYEIYIYIYIYIITSNIRRTFYTFFSLEKLSCVLNASNVHFSNFSPKTHIQILDES
jgi:hypothetical protein